MPRGRLGEDGDQPLLRRRPGRRAGGCGRRRPGPSPRCARRRRRRCAAGGGSSRMKRRQAVRRQRRDDPTVGRRPALVAVLAEEVEVAAGLGEGVADVVQAAQRERLSGGPAGDHGDRERLWRQREEDLRGVGVDVRLGRVVDDRREHPVEVEPDDGARQVGRQRVVPLAGRRRGELHGAKPTTPRTGGSGEGQPSSPVSTTVSRSSFMDSTAGWTRWMPRSRASSRPAALSRWREVDRGGRDGADPVVGADDLPPGAGRPVADAAGETGDAGVVVDLDVDLAAIDHRLGLLVGVGVGATGVSEGDAEGGAAAGVISRSVGAWSRVATKAIPAIATAMTLSITSGEG